MTKYIIQRILAMLVTLFIIVTIGFMVIRLMPGGIFDDAVDMTYEQREALEAKYNLDKPIPVQYALFLKGLVLEGDWGTSLKMYVNVPVWEVIKTKIPVTLYINFFSLIISLPLGIILGIVAAVRKNTMTDYLISLYLFQYHPLFSLRCSSILWHLKQVCSQSFLMRQLLAWINFIVWHFRFWRCPLDRSPV